MKKIVLIVGPSGVGKDTILRSIKGKIDVNFVKRYITRVPSKDEDNYFVDNDAFAVLKRANFFVSTWEAHGNSYGIPKNQIKNGLNIISISRGSIKDFEKIYEKVFTVEITLPKDMLYERLKKRARENDKEIYKRLERSYDKIEAKNLTVFSNDKDIESSTKDFIKVLKGLL